MKKKYLLFIDFETTATNIVSEEMFALEFSAALVDQDTLSVVSRHDAIYWPPTMKYWDKSTAEFHKENNTKSYQRYANMTGEPDEDYFDGINKTKAALEEMLKDLPDNSVTLCGRSINALDVPLLGMLFGVCLQNSIGALNYSKSILSAQEELEELEDCEEDDFADTLMNSFFLINKLVMEETKQRESISKKLSYRTYDVNILAALFPEMDKKINIPHNAKEDVDATLMFYKIMRNLSKDIAAMTANN